MKQFKIHAAALAALIGSAAPALAAPQQIVVLGDSLTAGYGVAPGEAFPEQLQAALQAKGHDVTVVNAGVSGDTASGGLQRLEWSVPATAGFVIVELGANDMLRGMDPAVTRDALDRIVGTLTGRGQAVLVAGMRASPTLGHAYGEQFGTIYPDIAEAHGAALYPFFLEGVVGDAALNQPDGIHPTATGVARIVERMLPAVEKLLAKRPGG